MVTTKISLIDFNSMPCYYDVLTKKGASYEHGQNYFFSSDGIPASIRIPQMRPTLSGQLQDAKLFVRSTSENAVKTQIWIAISIYVLIAIIKKELRLKQSLYTILQILSVTIFNKTYILQALTETTLINEDAKNDNQLELFKL